MRLSWILKILLILSFQSVHAQTDMSAIENIRTKMSAFNFKSHDRFGQISRYLLDHPKISNAEYEKLSSKQQALQDIGSNVSDIQDLLILLSQEQRLYELITDKANILKAKKIIRDDIEFTVNRIDRLSISLKDRIGIYRDKEIVDFSIEARDLINTSRAAITSTLKY